MPKERPDRYLKVICKRFREIPVPEIYLGTVQVYAAAPILNKIIINMKALEHA